MIMDMTTESFEREVLGRSYELPVAVDVQAGRFGRRRTLRPVHEGEAQRPSRERLLANVDGEQPLASRYGTQNIPSVARSRDGKRVTGLVCAHPATTIGHFRGEVINKHTAAVECP